MDKIVSQTPPSNLSNQITPKVVEKPTASQDLVIKSDKNNLSSFSAFTIYKILIGLFIVSILMATASLIGLKFKRGQPKEAQLKFEVPPLPSPTPTPTPTPPPPTPTINPVNTATPSSEQTPTPTLTPKLTSTPTVTGLLTVTPTIGP